MGRRVILTTLTVAVLIVAAGFSRDAYAADPNFILSGVVFVEGGNGGRAWLQEPTLTQNEVVPLRPGESIGPYRLTAIQEDRVELQGPAGKVVVFLAGAGAPAAPVADSGAASGRRGTEAGTHDRGRREIRASHTDCRSPERDAEVQLLTGFGCAAGWSEPRRDPRWPAKEVTSQSSLRAFSDDEHRVPAGPAVLPRDVSCGGEPTATAHDRRRLGGSHCRWRHPRRLRQGRR